MLLQGIQKMRDAGKLAARVLDYAGTLVQPGTTTDQIDKAVHKMIVDNGAVRAGCAASLKIIGSVLHRCFLLSQCAAQVLPLFPVWVCSDSLHM